MGLKYGIIGCGLIGQKRATALPPGALISACDLNLAQAQRLVASHSGATVTTDAKLLLNDPKIDALIIATINNALAPLALAAIQAGKQVLVEKPAAISVAEIDELISAADRAKVIVSVGFNHRYHPALQKARELIDAGAVGPLMFLRARYGHGGRVGYDREWRANPKLSGGGELIDQGVHLIDLSRWFLGEFPIVQGHATTSYWDMPVDDNAFLSLRTEAGQTAWLHVSCSEWKNLFSMEIYGRDGKLQIDGLGGSYGIEKLMYYKMLPEMGPPETTAWEYPRGDESWRRELEHFARDIELKRTPDAGLAAARAALVVVESIYAQSKPNLLHPHLPST